VRRFAPGSRPPAATQVETFDITLACSEAFANSIGNPLRPATLIVDVEATLNAHRLLTLVVRDYALARPERSPEETSMFLRLMETLVESAETHARPDGATVVLRRHLRLRGRGCRAARRRQRAVRSRSRCLPAGPSSRRSLR
jgi:anti-sigma regulatory factor (Ser/Thr protein kinase)